MKIVIVGASGNVGTATLRAFRDQGGNQLVAVARRVPDPSPPYDSATWHSIDVSGPEAGADLTRAFDGADCVVNLAWAFQPGRDYRYLERVGVGGLRSVLQAARSADVPHVIHMSSVGAYSPAPRGQAVNESWPTGGVPSSAYSRDKAAAERVLDNDEATGGGPAICRLRPGLIMQRWAGSSLLRYGAPAWLPAAALDLLPILPLDRTFSVPVVHSRAVAGAIVSAARKRATGAFNLAAPSPLTTEVVAAVLRARAIHLPAAALRAVVATGWMLRLERLDPGWIDLAFSVPLLDTTRAGTELDWRPTADAAAVFREAVIGMRSALSTPAPPLRARSVSAEITALLRRGPITRRLLP